MEEREQKTNESCPREDMLEAEVIEGAQTYMEITEGRLTEVQTDEKHLMELPKDNGKTRKLGIPTLVDRVIQQSIAQVLTPMYEPQFSEGSYGFRPNRSAQGALRQAGKRCV